MDFKTSWQELARLLEAEWKGQNVNRSRLHELAANLNPHFPDMNSTLGSIQRRTAQAAE